MNEYFCPFCGIKTKNNTTQSKEIKGIYRLHCTDCEGYFRFDIEKQPTKTFTEIQKAFVKIQLTPNQEFGSKKGRRKKI